MTPTDNTDARVGFRDIYRAVTESEVRVTAAIERAVSPLTAQAADHEVRLRALEAVSPSDQKQAIAALREDVARIEQDLSNAAAIAGRRATDVGIAQKTLVTIVIVSNFILGLVVMFTNLISAH